MYDLIKKKKRGGSLLAEEVAYMVRRFVAGDIPDYQTPAMSMAIYFRGMGDREIIDLTPEMAYSGGMVDLSPIEGIEADEHDTGSVGDKTTLVTGSIVVTYGIKVAKMSGRGLGHTSRTADRLESIPGFRTVILGEEFLRTVSENGLALIGQSGNMVLTGKKLYTLRDVAITADNIPFIVSSIMSKKLTAGNDCIVLDVETGGGAFIKTPEDPISLVRGMVSIETLAGRRCYALIANMDVPLGHAIDNSLEMGGAIETLKGRGPEDSTCVYLELAANMLHMAGRGNMGQCRKTTQGAMEDGSALRYLKSMTESQGKGGRCVENPGLFHKASLGREVKVSKIGFITHMDAEGIGVASVMLGAGRNEKEDTIDYSAGILLEKKYGNSVREGGTIAVLYVSYEELLRPAMEKFLVSCTPGKQMLELEPLIFTGISNAGVERRTIEEKIP